MDIGQPCMLSRVLLLESLIRGPQGSETADLRLASSSKTLVDVDGFVVITVNRVRPSNNSRCEVFSVLLDPSDTLHIQ